MSITRIDSDFYRGEGAQYETSSFCALNPNRCPGSFVAAGATAGRDSLGGQVACRLSLDHFVDGVLNYFEGAIAVDGAEKGSDISTEVLEIAFKEANSSVYNFGHSLAAGGRMAASLIGMVVENRVVAAGRVGFGSAYLIREGSAYPFFEPPSPEAIKKGALSFVGSQSLVSVELASIPVEAGDILALFSTFLEKDEEQALGQSLSELDFGEGRPCEDLCRFLFPDLIDLSFAMVARIGPETILLR